MPTQAGWLGEEEAGKAGWDRDSWWGNSGPVAPAQVAPITLNPYVTGTSQSITITPSPVTLEMDGRVIDEH